MTACRLLIAFGALLAVSLALDCRKFSFAPACRGILLKRASANEEYELLTDSCTTPAEVIGKVMEAARLAGFADSVDMAFLRSYFNKALTETLAVQSSEKL